MHLFFRSLDEEQDGAPCGSDGPAPNSHGTGCRCRGGCPRPWARTASPRTFLGLSIPPGDSSLRAAVTRAPEVAVQCWNACLVALNARWYISASVSLAMLMTD